MRQSIRLYLGTTSGRVFNNTTQTIIIILWTGIHWKINYKTCAFPLFIYLKAKDTGLFSSAGKG